MPDRVDQDRIAQTGVGKQLNSRLAEPSLFSQSHNRIDAGGAECWK